MTIRTQQDGYPWDPPAWCATEGCDRRAKVGSQWCFKCADKGTAIHYGGGDVARIRSRVEAVELFGEDTGAMDLYDMAPGAGAPSGGAGEQAAEAVREREAVSVRRHLQIRWERVHAGMADLILALRREGLDEAADEVAAGMDQIGKAVTRAGRGSGR